MTLADGRRVEAELRPIGGRSYWTYAGTFIPIDLQTQYGADYVKKGWGVGNAIVGAVKGLAGTAINVAASAIPGGSIAAGLLQSALAPAVAKPIPDPQPTWQQDAYGRWWTWWQGAWYYWTGTQAVRYS